MPKPTGGKTPNPVAARVSAKRPGIRSLKTLEDLRRLQARLVRQYHSEELPVEMFKALMYGTATLCQTMKLLQPGPDAQAADWVVTIARYDDELELEAQIAKMNSEIMEAPEENE